MRVAMVHWAFLPIVGGVESHLASLGEELGRMGIDVSLFTGSVNGPTSERAYGMDIERSPSMDLNRLQGTAVDPRVLQSAFDGFLNRHRPDVVHAHNMHYFSAAHLDALSAWCRRKGIALVLTAHNVWGDELFRSLGSRRGVYARVIAVSGYVADEMAKAGYDRNVIDVIHHGLDAARFSPKPARREAVYARYPELRGRTVIFHPARSSVTKGTLVAIDALARIRASHPETTLVCAGAGRIVDWDHVQGAELAAIGQRVRDLGLESQVLLRPFTWEEMADMYQVADVTVYPSINEEPFGIAVIEAMATGSPVIVTASGGMPEFVADGQTGYVVPRNDAPALAHRLETLLGDADHAHAMADRARLAVRSRHSVQLMATRTVESYRRAAGSVEHTTPA